MPQATKPFELSELDEVGTLDAHVRLTQEQAEAILQIQSQSSILDGFKVLAKVEETNAKFQRLGEDDLEDLSDGLYSCLQLWARR